MKEKASKTIYGLSIVSIFFLIGVLFSFYQSSLLDTFWHIGVGRWIIENKAIPHEDVFSYFHGLKFIAHEWLFGVIIYAVHFVGNMGGIKFFMSVIFSLTMLINYKTLQLRIKNNAFSLTLIIVTAFLFIGFVQARPQIISLLLLATLLYILEFNAKSNNSIKILLFIPIIVLVIANLHGGTLPLFLGIIFIYFINEVIKTKKIKNPKTLSLMGIGITSVLFGFINPYGYEIYLYSIRMMGSPEVLSIREWQPLIGLLNKTVYSMVILIPLIILMFTSIKKDFKDLFLILFTTFLALTQGRHFLIWVEFIIILESVYIYDVARRAMKYLNCGNIIARVSSLKNVLSIMFMIIAIYFSVLTINTGFSLDQNLEEGKIFPQQALEYIKKNNIDVKNEVMVNFYDWGGYLLYKDYKVFVDGRADVYMSGFNPGISILKDYFKLSKNTPKEQKEFLDKYNAKYILCPPNSNISNYASTSNEWTLLYSDKICNLFQQK